jgi:hypothetical protein
MFSLKIILKQSYLRQKSRVTNAPQYWNHSDSRIDGPMASAHYHGTYSHPFLRMNLCKHVYQSSPTSQSQSLSRTHLFIDTDTSVTLHCITGLQAGRHSQHAPLSSRRNMQAVWEAAPKIRVHHRLPLFSYLFVRIRTSPVQCAEHAAPSTEHGETQDQRDRRCSHSRGFDIKASCVSESS